MDLEVLQLLIENFCNWSAVEIPCSLVTLRPAPARTGHIRNTIYSGTKITVHYPRNQEISLSLRRSSSSKHQKSPYICPKNTPGVDHDDGASDRDVMTAVHPITMASSFIRSNVQNLPENALPISRRLMIQERSTKNITSMRRTFTCHCLLKFTTFDEFKDHMEATHHETISEYLLDEEIVKILPSKVRWNRIASL